MAARRIGPEGMVLAPDISALMLALTQEAAREADLPYVRMQVMDAQHLELESGSFDMAIARFSLQFIPDLQGALAEVRRVLKPGGTFAAVVFSAVDRNVFRASPQAIASRLAGKQFPRTRSRIVGAQRSHHAARCGAAGRLSGGGGSAGALRRAIPIASGCPAQFGGDIAPLAKLLNELSEDDRAIAWAEARQALQPFVGPDGFSALSEAPMVVGAA